MLCCHVTPSIVYAIGETFVVLAALDAVFPQTIAIACCGTCCAAGVHVTHPSLDTTTGVVPFPVAIKRFAYEFHVTEYPVFLGVYSPLISNATISRHRVKKGPLLLLTGNQLIPLASEYAIE